MSLSDDFATATAKAESAAAKAAAADAEAAFVRVVPALVHRMVNGVAGTLAAVADNVESLPPSLDLSDGTEVLPAYTKTKTAEEVDPSARSTAAETARMQFRDLMCWEVEANQPDPGQAVALRKYEAVNMLLIAERATTREEAVDAMRLCDEHCVMLSNQEHCVKNPCVSARSTRLNCNPFKPGCSTCRGSLTRDPCVSAGSS